MPKQVEQGRLTGADIRCQVGDASDHQPPGHLLGLLFEVNAVKSISATSAWEIHCPVCSSNIASV
jgi:hypothetical protein